MSPERTAVLTTLAAAIEGGALAWLQWRVLRARLARLRAGEWTVATVSAAILGSLVLVGPFEAWTRGPGPWAWRVALFAAAGAGAGAIFGAVQARVLRRHAERAERWIAFQVPVWALATAGQSLAAPIPGAGIAPAAALYAANGLALGLLLAATTLVATPGIRPWVRDRPGSLAGRVYAVTGATSGIGFEIALGLARRGASVVLLCRSVTRGALSRRAMLQRFEAGDLHTVYCDLSSFASIRSAAAEIRQRWDRLDGIVHAAGDTFPERRITEDGVERTFAIDVAGPFLLTTLLADRLAAAAGRVVTLTGLSQRRGRVDPSDLDFGRRPYSWSAANAQAQRARILFTAELGRRAPQITAAAVHPGAVLTRATARIPTWVRVLAQTLLRPVFVRAELGAMPALRLLDRAVHPPSGRFFDRFGLAPDVPGIGEARALWEALERLAAPDPTHHAEPAPWSKVA